MQASHLELNVELAPHFRHDSLLQAPWKISVKEAEVGHEGRLALMAKRLASSLVRFPERLRQRRMNEKAAKVFVKEVDFLQPDGEWPEGGGDARGPANQITARTHATPQQGYVRGKLRTAVPCTQSVDNPRQAIAHLSPGHEPQGVSFPRGCLGHGKPGKV
jgi:hypothetical protein